MFRGISQVIAGLLPFRISDTSHGVLFSEHFRRLLGHPVLPLVVRSSPPAGAAAAGLGLVRPPRPGAQDLPHRHDKVLRVVAKAPAAVPSARCPACGPATTPPIVVLVFWFPPPPWSTVAVQEAELGGGPAGSVNSSDQVSMRPLHFLAGHAGI